MPLNLGPAVMCGNIVDIHANLVAVMLSYTVNITMWQPSNIFTKFNFDHWDMNVKFGTEHFVWNIICK
jgi:hypothetical protein